jgi:replication fork protection complex subunit Tof1/Swi1
LDDELDKGTDYTQLLQSHLHYKAALLNSGVMQALFGIILPPLSKPRKERQERDGQVVNVVLHLIRNLAFIKDLPSNSHLSADQAEFSGLQTKLVRALEETHMLQLLLTIAANADKDPLLNGWNTLALEIFYLLFRGVKPASLAMDQAKARLSQNLHLHRLEAYHATFGNRNPQKHSITSSLQRIVTAVISREKPPHGTPDLAPPLLLNLIPPRAVQTRMEEVTRPCHLVVLTLAPIRDRSCSTVSRPSITSQEVLWT